MTNKALGQHWLYNRAILDEIASLAKSSRSAEHIVASAPTVSPAGHTVVPAPAVAPSVCVEIGPGLGTLTAALLRQFEKVIAVEFDVDLARKLPGSFPGKNLEVVNEDILRFDFSRIEGPYAVAGNIPYYITSPIVEKMVKLENLPTRVVLLMQKEVAERIAAGCVDRDGRAVKGGQSVLSLMVQNRAEVELGPVVSRSEFTPPPKVDSRVLVLTPHAPTYPEEMFSLIKQGFSSPRKKLIHNLPYKEALIGLGISLDARPADLNLEQWYQLSEKLKN